MEQQSPSQNTEGINYIAYALIPTHLFFVYYDLFSRSTQIFFMDNIYQSLIHKISLVTNPFFIHFLCVVLFSIQALTTPIGKDRELNEQEVIKKTILGMIILLIGAGIFYILPYNQYGFFVYICLIFSGYYFFISNVGLILKLITMKKTEVFNFENETFPQMEERIETEHSINIPYYFYYQGKWRKGWLNFVNPFRAILVAGSPGSGKSFGTINLAIHQLIHKGYCLYVYDFKLPTLALEVFNGLWHYGELLKKKHGSIQKWEEKTNRKFPKYYQIDLQNPITSHRINPIASRLVKEIIDATESSKFIMQGLSGAASGGDDGDFFKKSAESLLTATIWYLKRKSEQYGREFCSLPHVIEFLKQDYEILFALMMSDPDAKKLATTFDRAFKSGALEQLQGQVDSLVIMLNQIVDPTVYWVFTGEDFDLNISNPNDPSILVIGNNPDRFQSYGVLLSLLNGKLTKTINRKGQLPLGIIVDECPTLPFDSLSVLIATARSNKVACVLGIQDLAQFVLLYGKDKADMIVNMVGSILTGQIRGELAKVVSECIGKINQKNIQESLSAQGTTSYSISEQQTEAVPVSTISNLDQGEMAGTISGDFKARLKYPRFHGRIDATAHEASPTTQMPWTAIPEINKAFKIQEGESQEDRMSRVEIGVRENYERIRKDINLILYLELCRFERQKYDSVADIRLDIIGDGISEHLTKINKYKDSEGKLTDEGKKQEKKRSSLLTHFKNNIQESIAMQESERQSLYKDGVIVEALKKPFTNFERPVCKALQAFYCEFETTLYSTNISGTTRTEPITSPEELLTDEEGCYVAKEKNESQGLFYDDFQLA
jgi:TraM recognition site of TraD and TraG/YWFCY protein